jgi:hypothetical protein
MSSRHENLRDRLVAVAEELGERALERLRAAVDEDGGAPDAGALAEERRLTRARRAVEKAVHLLDGPGDDGPD